jgi:hypothetical protein
MKRTTLLCAVLFLAFPLFAQEAAREAAEPPAEGGDVRSDYRLGEDGKIRQRIAWSRANAYFYEIEIEKIGPGAAWQPELKERTEQNFLEVSLTPGMYRYRILSYNVLGRVGAVSEWAGIRVFAAKQPAAESYSPAGYFFDSPAQEFTLTLTGRDLAEEAQVRLVPQTGGAGIAPSSLTYRVDETALRAVFPAEALVLGAYDIVITNPGGLEQRLEGFFADFRRPLDISVSLAYAPLAPLYGYFFDIYDAPFYPLGLYARARVVPLKRLWGWIGFELGFHYAGLKTQDAAYGLSGGIPAVYADALYQKWNRNCTLALNLRLGGGLVLVSNIQFSHRDGSRSERAGTARFAVNAGTSVQWFMRENIFVEAGAEYVHLFSPWSPAPGFIVAALALGTRF